MNNTPLYVSAGTTRSIWQTYTIFSDHLELATHLGTINIPFDAIEEARVDDSDIKGLLHGNLKLRNFRPALKIDWANLTEHVVLDKSTGTMHRILFTPENPRAFVDALNQAMAAWRART